MPLPWETPELVRDNLRILATLKAGDKLSVLKEGQGTDHFVGNRGLRERFKISSSWITRSKKGETITNRALYLRPLVTLFTRAAELTIPTPEADPNLEHGLAPAKSRREVSLKEIDAAADGVRRLKATYDRQYSSTRDPDHLAHREAARELVDQVTHVVAAVARRPMADLGLPMGAYGMQLPTAKAWFARVPRDYRANEFAARLKFLLEAYEANSVLFQRPQDQTYRKVYLRFDLYLATKIWLDHNPALRLSRGEHGQYDEFHEAVDDLHQVAANLLCKSLRARPEELQRQIESTFGRKVGEGLLVEDLKQNQAKTLDYLDDVQRQKYRLFFVGGRSQTVPFRTPRPRPRSEPGPPHPGLGRHQSRR